MRRTKRHRTTKDVPTQPTQPLHPIGCERHISIDVTRYDGELPSEEPVDWFIQSDELDDALVSYERRVDS